MGDPESEAKVGGEVEEESSLILPSAFDSRT